MQGKLYRFKHMGLTRVGILEASLQNKTNDAFLVPFSSHDTNAIIADFATFYKELKSTKERVALSEVEILSPIKSPMQDVICIGINYIEHVKESMRFKKEAFSEPKSAVYFSKRVNECGAPYGRFCMRDLTKQLDYEVELVVIIGKNCTNVTKNEANKYIFGYTIGNDISARDLQLKHTQWYAGKSLEGSFPLGPCIVLRDSLNPHNLSIKSYVNDELRQDSNTKEMIFDIPYVIAELSSYFTLKCGTLISMGTPSGVGMGFSPPRFLHIGDVVRCQIEGIGEITTHIE